MFYRNESNPECGLRVVSVGRVNHFLMCKCAHGNDFVSTLWVFALALLTVPSQGPLLISHLLANLFTLECL